MEKRTKIIIIGIVCVIGATWFIWGPITFMIVGGLLSSFITSITSDEEYLKRASQNPVVKQYIESFPNYTTSQHNEFLGWRIIYFDVKDGPSMYVKVSNLHGGTNAHVTNNFGNWSGGGIVVSSSEEMVLSPSQNDIQTVMDVTKLPSDKVINALLESDNDVTKAIKYLEDNP